MAENKTFDEKEYITKMYESTLESQKQGLQQDHDQNQAALDEQQKKLQKQTDANLTRTYVEAAKDKQNYNEVQNAYGLSSGAMGQARLAQDNQLQADLTALRAAQQTAEAGIEQERGILAKEYAAAIRKAQADSDLAKVQALYEQAQAEDERLLAQQEAAAKLMAGEGDYSRLAALYGLTAEEVAKLNGESGEAGNSGSQPNDTGNDGNQQKDTGNPGWDEETVREFQTAHGLTVDGIWGPETAAAYAKDPNWDGGGAPATYDSILQQYLQLKKAGASTRETDPLLRAAVDDKIITMDQAAEIRDTRYEVN